MQTKATHANERRKFVEREKNAAQRRAWQLVSDLALNFEGLSKLHQSHENPPQKQTGEDSTSA